MLTGTRNRKDAGARFLVFIVTGLVMLIVAVQLGIRHGRDLAREDCNPRAIFEEAIRESNAALHTDGYPGALVLKDGAIGIVYPHPTFKVIQARAEESEGGAR